MQRRGMYDTALDYIDYLNTSRLADETTRQALPYYRAVTLIDSAGTERDPLARQQRLSQAEAELNAFLAARPDHPRAGSASTRLGGVLMQRGRAELDGSEQADDAAAREEALQRARAMYGRADDVFTSAIDRFENQLAALPTFIDRRDEQRAAARQQLRLDLADARLSAAGALREQALTYADADADRKRLLEQAVARYQAVFDDDEYRSKPVRWFARLQQGWCYEELGKMKEALVACDELLVLPNEPAALARLKAETMHLAMTCWLDERSRDLNQAVAKGNAWLETLGEEEGNTADANAVRWLTSEALLSKAAALPDDGKHAVWTETALALAEQVSRQPGPYRGKARALLVAHRAQADAAAPTTFADSFAEGQRLLESSRSQEDAVRQKAQLDESIALLQRALRLAPGEVAVKPEDVNRARYYLAFAMYQAEQFFDAAVIGEFLASRHADDPQARAAARIGLFALWSAYDRAPADDRDFELARMTGLAELIAQSWPDSTEASEAWMLLGDVALADGDIDAAIERYGKIDENSPRRALADLRAGRAIWIQVVRDAAANNDGDTASPDQGNAAERLTLAREMLQRSVSAMQKGGGELTADLVIGQLSLAQLNLHSGDAETAVEVLTRGDNAIADLLANDHEVTHRPGFATEAYKTLLRAYIAARDFEQAEQVMAGMDEAAAAGRVASDDVTRIYLGLGRELEDELVRLEASGEDQQLARVRESFEQFLSRVAQRPEANTFGSLLWVGDTYLRLGAGVEKSDPSSARRYYAEASKALGSLLKRSEQDASFAPSPENVWSVRIKLAECQRREGNYRGAVDQLVDVLKQRPNLLTAQVEAAETYQAWGKQDPSKYALAVRGDKKARRKDGKPFNLIWGWAKLGNALQASPDHRELYFEARYRQAECWYRAALAGQGDEKLRDLRLASSTLLATHRLTPLTPGDEWYAKYDALLKRIRQDSGESAAGLPPATKTRG
ncbi:MAG: hypothetical protein KDA63_03670 [Planctomycetales bacterium]|nr:hypothetical protein [Planctomycetales bacterium]